MKKSASFRRSVRHSVFGLGLLGLVAGLLGIGSTASAAPVSCEGDNSTTLATYSSLQAAIDAAAAGNTLEVKGTCVGTSIVTKNLRITGGSPRVSILEGNGAGSTLTVNPSVAVSVNRLTIQDGASLLNSHFVTGGANVPWVNIGGAQLPPTLGTANYVFVGRACNGDTLLANPSGKVALIRRGDCFFSDKAANAAAAGATAAVIANRIGAGDFPQFARLVNAVTIPVVGISDTAGTGMGNSGTLTWADWTSTYTDPISGARLPAWTGSFVDNFIGNCSPAITLGSFSCNP